MWLTMKMINIFVLIAVGSFAQGHRINGKIPTQGKKNDFLILYN